MIVIVDYGMGNLRSVQSKIEMLKYSAVISSNPDEIFKASKLILPGVGFFGEAMKNIKLKGLIDVLNQKVQNDKVPILGICLGMQLLTMHSEEGDSEGLKWIDGKVKRFRFNDTNKDLRIPHVGWNKILKKQESILFRDIPENERFYFTHSYCVECDVISETAALTEYGYQFVSVVQKNNVYGTQFHPEKSHKTGLKMIDNFLRYS